MKNLYQILLADDDHDDCHIFEEAVADLAINAVLKVVNDGAELMNFLHSTNVLPDVVFLDLNMPRKSGMECLDEIKSDEALKFIPVVVYSTSLVPEVLNMLYFNGADFCIVKPPDFTDLKNVIGQAFSRALEKGAERTGREVFLIQP